MILFLIVAAIALATALLVVLNPNPVRSALFLVVNLFCVAGLYLLLNAYFLSAVQVIVYTGAIMVLFLFVIMLLNLGTPDRSVNKLKGQTPLAVLGGILMAGMLVSVVLTGTKPTVPRVHQEHELEGASPNAAAKEGNASGRTAPRRQPTEAEREDRREQEARVEKVREDALAGKPLLMDAPEPMVGGYPLGSPQGIGKTLYDPKLPWLFPFEVTSILLLIAVIGSVVLARRSYGEEANKS